MAHFLQESFNEGSPPSPSEFLPGRDGCFVFFFPFCSFPPRKFSKSPRSFRCKRRLFRGVGNGRCRSACKAARQPVTPHVSLVGRSSSLFFPPPLSVAAMPKVSSRDDLSPAVTDRSFVDTWKRLIPPLLAHCRHVDFFSGLSLCFFFLAHLHLGRKSWPERYVSRSHRVPFSPFVPPRTPHALALIQQS